jgi:hypothetical protein
MTFLNVEQVMDGQNGTITRAIICTAVVAETFVEAIQKLKDNAARINLKWEVEKEDDQDFEYVIKQAYPVYGSMKNRQLRII